MRKFFAIAKVTVSVLVTAALLIISHPVSSQKGRIDSSMMPKIGPHYLDEYDFDVPTSEGAWKSQSGGLQAAFGSTDELYFRKEVPMTVKVLRKNATAWKGERVNLQILVWGAGSS